MHFFRKYTSPTKSRVNSFFAILASTKLPELSYLRHVLLSALHKNILRCCQVIPYYDYFYKRTTCNQNINKWLDDFFSS